jgi:hypothetical protein
MTDMPRTHQSVEIGRPWLRHFGVTQQAAVQPSRFQEFDQLLDPSSTSAGILSGIVRPSAFAVFRLMIKSNLVGCSILTHIGSRDRLCGPIEHRRRKRDAIGMALVSMVLHNDDMDRCRAGDRCRIP